MSQERSRRRPQPFVLILSLALVGIVGLEGVAIWLTRLHLDRLEQEVAVQAEFLDRARSIAPDAAGVREAAATAEAEVAGLEQRLPVSLGATEIVSWLRQTTAGAGTPLVSYALGPPRKEGRLTAIPVQVEVRIRSVTDVLALLAATRQAPFPVRTGMRTLDFGDRESLALTLTVYTRKGVTYP